MVKLRSAAHARALPAVDPRLAHRPEYAGRRVAGRPDLIAKPGIELEKEGGRPAKQLADQVDSDIMDKAKDEGLFNEKADDEEGE